MVSWVIVYWLIGGNLARALPGWNHRRPTLSSHFPVARVGGMELAPNVEVRSDVMLGKPCLKGTRIPVYLVLEKLGAGETVEDLLKAYPQLTPDDIRGALQYADALAGHSRRVPS